MKEYMPHTAARMAESLIKRNGLLTARWSYDYGVVWRGMEALHALTGESRWFDYIRDAMDTFVQEDGSIRDYTFDAFNLDYVCNGRQLLYLYKATGEEKYRKAADMLREQLRRQPRTSDGGFWHKKCYPCQMWLDGLHMAAPFYTEYCLMVGDDEGVRDAAKQLRLAYEHTFDPATGLNHHAWDESRAQMWSDPETGRAAHAWGRAVGWYMVALADVLELLPENHPCFAELRVLFEKLARRMLEVRDGGVWLQVMDCPGREGNYRESSGSCLMIGAMLKMARLGYVPGDIGDAAAESFRAAQREFVFTMRDGTMFLAKTCHGAGLGGQPGKYRDGSYAYYISEAVGSYDLKGTGAYIQAAVEYEMRDEATRRYAMLDQRLKSRIDNFVSRLQREDVCMHGFILSVGGQVKATAYYAPFEEGRPHRLYSVSKTMTALAIGILLDEGKLALDDHIVDYFQDYLPETPDERLMRLTIRDMLRMATCYRWTAYREGVDEDWTKPFFTAASTHEPGTVFNYDTGCSQVLAALVKRLSGQEVIDFLNERVFTPLGACDEKFWLRDPSGTCQGGTGLCMSLRDMHKVARMVMEGGNGLVPRWFCEEMGKKHIDNRLCNNEEERYGYGWQVWMTRAGWAMYGLGGQLAVVCPEKDALLCTTADTRLDNVGVQRIYDAFFEEVYPYIGIEDCDGQRLSLKTQPVGNLPEFAMEAAGPYVFPEKNQLGLISVELRGQTLIWENAMGRNVLRFGVGENIVDVFPGWPELPTLCSGGWVEEGLLRVRCFIIGNAPCGVDMLLHFTPDALTVQSKKSFDPATNGYDGVATGYRA